MATKIYRLFLRPTPEVEFPVDDQEFIAYINETYVVTGKCLEFRAVQPMSDELTKVVASTWANEEEFAIALLDPAWETNLQKITEYSDNHGILVYSWTE